MLPSNTKLQRDELLTRLRTKSPQHFSKLVRLFDERNDIIEHNQGLVYTPNGKAEEFIKVVGANETFVSMFVAANGVGKSAAGANIVANIVFGKQSKWFDQPVFKHWPYLNKGRIISDPTTIKEKIIPELRKWFPVNESTKLPLAHFEESKEGKNYVCKITCQNGWIIDVMSTEQAVKEFESADLGFVWIDEPIPQDRFMATLARGRLGMIVFWTMTPLFNAAWIKDWMDKNVTTGIANYVEAEIEDNCKIHGTRGILEHNFIQRMADGMPEEEREARIFGRFGHLIGRVHKKFSRKVHVIKPFKIDPTRFTTYVALDPHPRVPDHALYLCVDKNGTKYFTSEIIHEGDIKLFHERMLEHEEKRGYRMESRIIDPSAFNDDQHREEASIGSQLFELGQTWVKGSKDLMAGIKRLNVALDYETVQGKFIKQPEMFVFDTCPVFIKQIEEYVWQEWKGTNKDEKQPRATPRDRDDHQVENAHRLLLAEPEYVPFQFRTDGKDGVDFEQEMKSLDPYA